MMHIMIPKNPYGFLL